MKNFELEGLEGTYLEKTKKNLALKQQAINNIKGLYHECACHQTANIDFINPKKNSYQELFNKQDKSLAIINVSPKDSYLRTHIKNSINIPINQIHEELNNFPLDKELIFYCNTTRISRLAYQIAENSGFTNISILENGLTGWSFEFKNLVINLKK